MNGAEGAAPAAAPPRAGAGRGNPVDAPGFVSDAPRRPVGPARAAAGPTGPTGLRPEPPPAGTLRAFGTLVAVAQLANGTSPVKVVGIEEPETALHPAASGALMDALREAAVHTQVVVTTHNPGLPDASDPATDRILVVRFRDGVTEIGPIDPASREAVEEHLYCPDE